MEPLGWPRIAVVGAGAVGCYFGGMLARAGAPVTLIGRRPHVEAITRDGLFLDCIHFQEHVRVPAATEVSAARGAEVVLFCVKTPDTEGSARALQPYLPPDAIVLSLQNGVDNVERIRAASGLDALAAVVYVAAAMKAPGHLKHSGRGDLVIGDVFAHEPCGPSRQPKLAAIAAMFARAGVPCLISENIAAELWVKLIMNCAFNAISALGRAKYRVIAHLPETRELIRQVVSETVCVASAAGVQLDEAAALEATLRLGETMSEATSSTAQDIGRRKRTEIDSLNGYVVRRGAELGIAVPVSQTLHALVKLLEESL